MIPIFSYGEIFFLPRVGNDSPMTPSSNYATDQKCIIIITHKTTTHSFCHKKGIIYKMLKGK